MADEPVVAAAPAEAPAAAPVAPAPTVPAPAPAAPAEPKPEVVEQPQPTSVVEPYHIEPNVPMGEMTEERTALLEDFQSRTAAVGMSQGDAQALVSAFVDVATAIPYSVEHEYTTPDEAMATLEQTYGVEGARAIQRDAHKFYEKAEPALQDYFDSTGIGNDLGALTVMALAERGLFKLDVNAAQAEINKIMRSKEYSSPDAKERKLEVVKVQILSRIAHGKTPTASEMANPKPQMVGLLNREPVSAVEDRQQALRNEMAALVPEKGSMSREQADKWMALNKQLNGGA